MSRSRPRLAWLCLLVICAGGAAPRAGAQSWTQPAKDLAEAIQSHVQTRGGIALTIRNLSSMDAGDFAEARRAVEAQLRALGLRAVPAEQAVEAVDVTLAESSSSYVWVAQIGHAEPRDTAMIAVPIPARTQMGAAMEVLRRTPLVTEPVRILDAVQVTQSGGPALVVLDAAGIKAYRMQSGRWTLESAHALPTGPLPRDRRGRLVVENANATIYLPGTLCAGQWTPLITMTCRASDDAWPLAIPGATPVRATFANRNYFGGAIIPAVGDGKTPFYSATRLTLAENVSAWLLTGLDGTVRVVSASGQTAATISGWGSSVAGATNTCSAAPYVLATRATAVDQPDAVRAYRLSGGKAVEASEALEFAGPVTEMWTQADGTSVLAISKNLRTGDYEASSLTLACSR